MQSKHNDRKVWQHNVLLVSRTPCKYMNPYIQENIPFSGDRGVVFLPPPEGGSGALLDLQISESVDKGSFNMRPTSIVFCFS